MNISSDKLLRARKRDGRPSNDRPQYVEDALTMDRRVGFKEGAPLVEHPTGADTALRLGEDVSEAYDHYRRGEELLKPQAHDFLQSLFDAPEIRSFEDAAAELNTDTSTVETAARLHGLNPPERDEDATEEDGGGNSIRLPSGERIPIEVLSEPLWTDKLVIAQLFSDGMGVREIARYLSDETGSKITPSDVREGARECGILEGGNGESDLRGAIPREERTVRSTATEVQREPW